MRIDVRHHRTRRLTLMQSRFAAIMLTVVSLALAYFLLLHWWFVAPMLSVDDQMHDLRVIHARYAAAIAEQPLLEKRLARLQRGDATVGAFLSATDPSAAAANLIQRATDVVAAHAGAGAGCSMPSKMPIEQGGAAREPFQRVSISITLDCGMQPLAAVLHDFDRGLPYLFVSNLMLARSPAGRMEAQLTVSGYLRPATP